MGLMMYPAVLATGFLALPTLAAQYADNDLWLTGILVLIPGLISIYVSIRLHGLYPGQTFIQSCQQIVGQIPGKIIGMIYCLFLVHITGLMTRQYAEFVTDNFLYRTPTTLIISSMILLCAFAVRGGVEMLARSAVIFVPLFILPLFFCLLLIPDLDVKNIFPVLSHGWSPVFKGAATPGAWVSELFLISFFLPHLSDPHKATKWSLLSLGTIMLSMIYVNLLTYLLLGTDTGNKIYPIFVAFRYIRAGSFIENFEVLLLAMWILGNFLKISVFFYAAVLSFAQSMKLSDYRSIVFPFGILILVFTWWDMPSYPVIGELVRTVHPFYLPTFLLVIPLFLFMAALIRIKLSNPRR